MTKDQLSKIKSTYIFKKIDKIDYSYPRKEFSLMKK